MRKLMLAAMGLLCTTASNSLAAPSHGGSHPSGGGSAGFHASTGFHGGGGGFQGRGPGGVASEYGPAPGFSAGNHRFGGFAGGPGQTGYGAATFRGGAGAGVRSDHRNDRQYGDRRYGDRGRRGYGYGLGAGLEGFALGSELADGYGYGYPAYSYPAYGEGYAQAPYAAEAAYGSQEPQYAGEPFANGAEPNNADATDDEGYPYANGGFDGYYGEGGSPSPRYAAQADQPQSHYRYGEAPPYRAPCGC